MSLEANNERGIAPQNKENTMNGIEKTMGEVRSEMMALRAHVEALYVFARGDITAEEAAEYHAAIANDLYVLTKLHDELLKASEAPREAPRVDAPQLPQRRSGRKLSSEDREALFNAIGGVDDGGAVGLATEALRSLAYDLEFFWSAMGDGTAPPNYEMVRALFGRLGARAKGAATLAEMVETSDLEGERDEASEYYRAVQADVRAVRRAFSALVAALPKRARPRWGRPSRRSTAGSSRSTPALGGPARPFRPRRRPHRANRLLRPTTPSARRRRR